MAGQDTLTPPESLVSSLREGLGACVEENAARQPRLSITLPDRGALNDLAQTLAGLLVVRA